MASAGIKKSKQSTTKARINDAVERAKKAAGYESDDDSNSIVN